MSIRASKTFGGLITYRMVRGVQQVGRRRRPIKAATMPQIAVRQRMSEAKRAYQTLPAGVSNQWRSLATQRGSNPWILFHQEWVRQRIQSPALPLIPAFY
jgi:hypothetical protein